MALTGDQTIAINRVLKSKLRRWIWNWILTQYIDTKLPQLKAAHPEIAQLGFTDDQLKKLLRNIMIT